METHQKKHTEFRKYICINLNTNSQLFWAVLWNIGRIYFFQKSSCLINLRHFGGKYAFGGTANNWAVALGIRSILVSTISQEHLEGKLFIDFVWKGCFGFWVQSISFLSHIQQFLQDRSDHKHISPAIQEFQVFHLQTCFSKLQDPVTSAYYGYSSDMALLS